MSETSGARQYLARFCVGNGVDLGFGGDKITPGAIGMDMPNPYTNLGDDPVQLSGDARDLEWFRDGVLDYVYSSHLLEDFTNTVDIMKEWTRVLKVGGSLVLLLPDEQLYRANCKKDGTEPNGSHKLEHFGPAYVMGCAQELGNLQLEFYTGIINIYSFGIVFKKTRQ